ncbi:MAG: proton-conducting transporter membrane subunit [Candidatus Omnitrophota bacterium]
MLLLTCVPIAAGLICLLMPDRAKRLIRGLAILMAASSLAGAVYVFMNKPVNWQAGQSIILIADDLSSFIGIGIALFASLVTIYSFGSAERSFGRYFGYLLITLGASFGVAFANDLLILLVFWGLLAAMLYLMVNMAGSRQAASAARKALIIIGGTDALMLFAFALMWQMTGTFSMDKIRLALDSVPAFAAFLCLAAASFAKAGAMPFHSWLPDVAEHGPTAVTAYLPASLDKLLGIYLLARVALRLFIMNSVSNTILLAAGAVTIILAVVIALVQHDMKRLLGYHAVSQVGYMVLGIGTGTAIGMAGSIFHMFNHAVYKSCLFLSAGNVEKRAGTTDLAKLGGLAKYMPVTFICFLTASLSISGIPPFNGFVSKWMVYQGIIESAGPKNPAWILWLTCAMFGSVLTVASFMKLIHAVFLGRPSEGLKDVKEARPSMTFPVAVLAIICFIFGAFAFIVPVPLFIAPAIGLPMAYLGIWKPVLATSLIIIGIALGFMAYWLFRPGQFRTVRTFVGGEDPEKMARVSGVEFYDTIKDLKALGGVYAREEEGSFDIYTLGGKLMRPLTGALQRLHNGILSTYLVWCALAMAAIFIFFLLR